MQADLLTQLLLQIGVQILRHHSYAMKRQTIDWIEHYFFSGQVTRELFLSIIWHDYPQIN
jgi:hypothetical protein